MPPRARARARFIPAGAGTGGPIARFEYRFIPRRRGDRRAPRPMRRTGSSPQARGQGELRARGAEGSGSSPQARGQGLPVSIAGLDVRFIPAGAGTGLKSTSKNPASDATGRFGVNVPDSTGRAERLCRTYAAPKRLQQPLEICHAENSIETNPEVRDRLLRQAPCGLTAWRKGQKLVVCLQHLEACPFCLAVQPAPVRLVMLVLGDAVGEGYARATLPLHRVCDEPKPEGLSLLQRRGKPLRAIGAEEVAVRQQGLPIRRAFRLDEYDRCTSYPVRAPGETAGVPLPVARQQRA